MITIIISILCLITGYVIYGRFVARVFGADSKRVTPCYAMADGVDYMAMPTWKVFFIQFLNIAGTGPIFGAIQGILFGPSAFIWIVLGCIFGGATHDYLAGMLSVRRNGSSLPEIIGDELGSHARQAMRVLALVLMMIVGAVFVITPAGLLASITPSWGVLGTPFVWCCIIFVYYLLATLLPIGKIIGRIYPAMGVVLIITALALFVCLFIQPGSIPEVTTAFHNHHPLKVMPLFPGLFVTISCGAISGFHATQSPMMARCLKNESKGRAVFYGSMITEGILALIWAAVTVKFVDSLDVTGSTPYEKVLNVMTDNGAHDMNPAILIKLMCETWLGRVGTVLAFLGIVVAPITTGDTAFRSARLIVAEFLHMPQDKLYRRIIITVPLFAIAIALIVCDFSVLWRYLGVFNQTLATFTFWALTMWLFKQDRNYFITLFPALFTTMLCVTYFIVSPEGLHLSPMVGYLGGGLITLATLALFIHAKHRFRASK